MKKIIKMTLLTILGIITIITLAVVGFFYTAPQIGGTVEGDRLTRVQESEHYEEEVFQNLIETDMDMSFGDMMKTMGDMLTGDSSRSPGKTIENIPFNADRFMQAADTEVVVTWFGHSSVLIKLDGKVILADPVFSERASMFSFMGPKEYPYKKKMTVDQLPEVDAVIISHDHYDHLDYETMTELKDKVSLYLVPLGVGAHLEKWGIPSEHIKEFDWWDETTVDGLKLVFTPSRHFSGRAIRDRFKTLWGSWTLLGKTQRLFFGGDSGYFPGFKDIGEAFGPFDLTMLECGQYNQRWKNIHMMPEETVQANVDLKGKLLMPIHWGKFTLALHPWKESVERSTAAAQKQGVNIVTPTPGANMVVYSAVPSTQWWKNIK